MSTQNTPQNTLDYITVGLKLKLAMLWTSFMFLYTYVDLFGLYMPDKISQIGRASCRVRL